MGVGTRIATRISTRIAGRGNYSGMNPTQPDLATAIVSWFESSPLKSEVSKIYRDKAGERAEEPYLVFSINPGAPILNTSTSRWIDQKVKFTVYSSDSDVANRVRDKVWKAYRNRSFDFEQGYSIPFFLLNQSEGKDANRAGGNSYVYRAGIEVSARTCYEVTDVDEPV